MIRAFAAPPKSVVLHFIKARIPCLMFCMDQAKWRNGSDETALLYLCPDYHLRMRCGFLQLQGDAVTSCRGK